MFAQVEDTIVAISSASGGSLRGVLRLSGVRAVEIATGMFSPAIDATRGFQRHRGCVRWSDERVVLPAELYVFRSPRSFTKQDVVEIHTIGSQAVLAGLLDEILRRGARQAEAGEFTGRAFLAGAMDLTAVEGVAAMVQANSDAQLRAAQQLLHGTLARETHRLQARIADLLSLVEASIDFVEEPIDFISPEQAAAELMAVLADMGNLLHHAAPMERLDTRYRVVLFGPPNAGKSTLFNRLTGLDRVICSSSPGTTRDVIAAPFALNGGAEAWLMDSAGVGHIGGAIDTRAVEFAKKAASGADLVLLIIDGARAIASQLAPLRESIGSSRAAVVINKVDVLGEEDVASARRDAASAGYPVQAISAATGFGCAELVRRLSEMLHAERLESPAAAIAVNARHCHALRIATEACNRAVVLIRRDARVAESAELVAIELREALDELGAIVGEVTTEEVLGRVFRRFCIGK